VRRRRRRTRRLRDRHRPRGRRELAARGHRGARAARGPGSRRGPHGRRGQTSSDRRSMLEKRRSGARRVREGAVSSSAMPRNRRLRLLIALAVLLLLWCRSRSRGELSGDNWRAGLDRYDYLESVEFAKGGEGEMVWGWDQAVRLEVRFRWEAHG